MNKPDAVAGVYRITHIADGKIYVGSAVNIAKRWWQHRALRPGCQKLLRALQKYGVEAFSFDILEVVPFEAGQTKESFRAVLTAAEQKWLDSLQPFDENGYNLAPRAQSVLGLVRSPEARENMAAARRGKKLSPEHIEKLTIARRKRIQLPSTGIKIGNALRGRKRDPETVEKVRLANTGKHHSPETIEKIRRLKTGLKQSPESRAKTSAALRGIKRSEETKQKIRKNFLGRRHSDESKRKMSIAHKGKRTAKRGPRKNKSQLPLF